MKIKPIRNDKDLDRALERLDIIFNAAPDTPDGDEAEILSLVIQDYESKHYQIENILPVEAIKVRMEDMGLEPKDLIPMVGNKALVSLVLNQKRPLSKSMIIKLHKGLNLSYATLIEGGEKESKSNVGSSKNKDIVTSKEKLRVEKKNRKTTAVQKSKKGILGKVKKQVLKFKPANEMRKISRHK